MIDCVQGGCIWEIMSQSKSMLAAISITMLWTLITVLCLTVVILDKVCIGRHSPLDSANMFAIFDDSWQLWLGFTALAPYSTSAALVIWLMNINNMVTSSYKYTDRKSTFECKLIFS